MGICTNVLSPPLGHLQPFFSKKTNARQMPGGGEGCVRLELTEPQSSPYKLIFFIAVKDKSLLSQK